MASHMIGIQIGPDALSIAQVSGGVCLAEATARIPQGLILSGIAADAAPMAALIRDTLALRGIRGRNCALVLPPQIVTAQRLRLPLMSRTELELNLPFEFRDILPRDPAEYDFDYIVLSMDDSAMELYAAAALRSGVDSWARLLKTAGLTLRVAIPQEMAWLNLIRQGRDLPGQLGIAAREGAMLRLSFFSEERFITAKELTDDADALRRALNAYRFSLPPSHPPLRDLIVCAEQMPENPLPELNLHPVSRLMPGVSHRCILAAGAALQRK